MFVFLEAYLDYMEHKNEIDTKIKQWAIDKWNKIKQYISNLKK